MAEQDWIDPQDFRFLLLNARWMRGWTQRELAIAAGVDKATIDRYENGRVPPRQAAERIFAAAGRSLDWLEVTLLPGIHAAGRGLPDETSPPFHQDPSRFAMLLTREIEATRVYLEAGISDEEDPKQKQSPPEPATERQRAESLWAILVPCTSPERRVLVARLPEYQGWAVVERLSLESGREAANDPDAALELARLALRAAEKMPPGPERERACGCASRLIEARRLDSGTETDKEAPGG